MSVPRIVVGTDGSPAGIATVRWAATEAWLRDAELSVLAYPERVPGDRRSVGTLVDAVREHSHCPVVIVPAGKPEEAP